jgi:NAD(P)-dependent dehydrogenase (short-subunit alcohol dehydrogenase family)
VSRAVLVTGAGSGIGAGIARCLAVRGWTVLVNDLDPQAAGEVADEVDGLALPGDAGDPQLVERAVGLTGGLAGLVNNAGIILRAPLSDLDGAGVDRCLAVNLRTPMLLAKTALPHLQASGGSVVNVASMTAESPQLGGAAYSASKAGLIAFTRQAAVEWGPRGVRVNAVSPGMVVSAMAGGAYADPALAAQRAAIVPLRRLGSPSEVGSVVAFLLSDDAAYVSGETVLVDGGLAHSLVGHVPQPGGAATYTSKLPPVTQAMSAGRTALSTSSIHGPLSDETRW